MSTTTRESDADGSVGGEALLHRGLGAIAIMFMVVAAVAPLGATTVVLPTVFALSGNASAPTYFIGAAIVLCLFSVGFTLMGRHVPNAGAFYTYVQAGLGKMAGAGAAVLALVSYLGLLVALYAYLGVAASGVLETYLDVSIPWWVLAFVGVALVAFLGYRDVDLSAKVLGVVLVLEIVLIMVVNVAIILKGGASGLSAAPLDPRDALHGAPGLGLMFAFFAFVGFEATAVFRSEAARPNRTVPRATYGAVIFIGILYALTSWAQAIGVGTDKVASVAGPDPSIMMLNLAGTYVGSAFQDLLQILLVTSIFACALSFHNVVARYQLSLANGRLLPATLGRVHPRHRAPSRSSLTVTVVTALALAVMILGGLDPVAQIYTWFSGAATLGIIVLMALTSLAVIVFHQRRDHDDPVWKATAAPILALLALCLVVYLAVDNLGLLVGGQTPALAVCAGIVGCFVLGAGIAGVKRIRRPEGYAEMLG
ncbi:APC family permease [Gordonia sp. SL306]|uniref:APC family permease n=1 Tax=Gordonia sp. SL306 TaxID=2995145 RepID=UPI00227119A9|nr:APC family permease [Gordonia sp. SL306]WAC57730.1 APC family permease [Gordonia sp. SL306]